MKKVAISILLVASAVAASGTTCTWRSGNGVWSSPDNWDDGLVPTNGCDVVLAAGPNDVTIENDIADLILKSIAIRRGSGSESVTLAGQGLTLTGELAFVSYVTAVVDVPLKFTSSCNVCVTNGYTGTFNQPVTLEGEIEYRQGYGKLGNNGYLYYNSTVTGPSATIASGEANMRSLFNAPIDVRCIHGGHGDNFSPVFNASGNRWDENWVGHWSRMIANVKDAFSESMVFYWEPIYYPGNSNSSMYEFYKDQTCDRINCPTLPVWTDGTFYNQYRLIGYKGSTLTLRGTDNASSCAVMENTFNLVWDPTGDYTQTFFGRTNTVTGTLTVRRGTISLEKNVTFKNVTGVTIGDGARLSIAEGSVNPFTDDKATLEVCGAGKIYVPADMTLKFAKISVSGLPLQSNVTYTAATSGGWILGPGSVVASETDRIPGTTFWQKPASGAWTNAVNWTDGVPTAETNAFITATDVDYTVTVDSDVTAGNVTLGNSSDTATLDIRDASLTIAADCQLTVKAGGVLRMGGETSAFTAGSATDTSGPNGLTVETGGEVRTTGGKVTLAFNRQGTNVGNPFGMVGGLAEYADTVVSLKSHHGGAERVLRSGTGTLRFDGASSVRIDGADAGGVQNTYVQPASDDEESRVEVLDHSAFVWGSTTFCIGGRPGHSTLQLETLSSESLMRSTNTQVGVTAGTGELLVQNGTVAAGACSFLIGSAGTNLVQTSLQSVTGIVEVCEGGAIAYSGEAGATPADQTLWGGSDAAFDVLGLMIGHGLPSQNEGSHYRGEVRILGGTLDDAYASCLIGSGPGGDGEVVQSGGKFHVMNDYTDYQGRSLSNEVAIGCFGGKGVYRMTGGEFSTRRNVYIGGATQADLHRTIRNVELYANQFHNASGRVSVDGDASFAALGRQIVLGADGTGILELSSTGTVTAASLVVSNTVGQTASELRFACDAAGEFGTLNVKSLRFCEGSKLVIDATKFPEKGLTRTLFSLSNPVEGLDYIKKHVEIVNCPGGGHEKWSDDGCKLRFGLMKGFWVIVR